MTDTPNGAGTAAQPAIDAAERAGYRLLLMARTAVLTLALLWSGFGLWYTGNATGPALLLVSLALGLLEWRSVGTPWERRWRRYAIVLIDVGCVALAASFVPLLSGQDVPQHFVLRAYGMHVLWLVPVLTVVALQPTLSAFAGSAAALAVGAIYAGATRDMTRTLSWGDLPRDADAGAYVALLLHPDFVGRGNRVEEAAALFVGGLIPAYAVRRARAVVFALAGAEDRRRRIEEAFGQHVPEWVARRLIEAPETLEPSVHQATVLHMDVENFTGFAAGRDPGEVMRRLDALLSATAAIVAAEGGIVVSYGGDSMLAVFGGPHSPGPHADRGFAAAKAILAALDRAPLRLRIGLATGPVAAGIVGGTARRAFTVYGEIVNRAQRLEQACKAAATRLLLSDETRAGLSPSVDRSALIAVDVERLEMNARLGQPWTFS